MDHFEYSQQVRREIESNREIYDNLVAHIKGQNRLDFLGGNVCSKHYRVGRLNEDLWIATRESNEELPQFMVASQEGLEIYCRRAFDLYEGQKGIKDAVGRYSEQSTTQSIDISTSFCIPVKYIYSEDVYAYLLLLEDLTAGGQFSARFPPGHYTSEDRDSDYKILKVGDSGIKIHYDLWDLHKVDDILDAFRDFQNIPDYTAEENMLIIRSG